MAYDAFIDVALPVRTNLPEDFVHNTFTVKGATTLLTDAAAISSALAEFYNADYAGTSMGIAHDLLGAQLDGAPTFVHVDMWDITGNLDLSSPMGSPDVSSDAFQLDTPYNPGLPSEVALVLSHHADYTGVDETSGSTRPRARRRGRVYIGPLAAGILAQTTPGIVRPSDDACDTLAGKWTDYVDALGAESISATVWSRADGANRISTNYHVDNAFDTQRRRGIAPSARFFG